MQSKNLYAYKFLKTILSLFYFLFFSQAFAAGSDSDNSSKKVTKSPYYYEAIKFIKNESYKNAIKFSLYILPVAYIINVLVGGEPGFEANLWYLMKAPTGESLMSFFPSPPLHIIPVFPLVMFVFYLLYLPYKFKEKNND